MMRYLKLLLIAVVVIHLTPAAHAQTGTAVPELTAFDTAIEQFMAKWNLPGGSLAIMKGSRLVFARGYGLANRVNPQPVQPDSLFRIGSNSKMITVAAVLKLVQERKLGLDQPIVPLLGPEILPPEIIADPRWFQITVRHLLQHSGGWDSDQTFEPMILTRDLLAEFGLTPPVTLSPDAIVREIIRYMAGRPLQFDPGTKAVYSNFGYCLLGRVVERASGRPFRDYVRSAILAPTGITRAAEVSIPPTGRSIGEVDYYSADGEPPMPSAYHADGRLVPPQDGGALGEPLDSVGGWALSSIDLLRFMTALDGRRGKAILKRAALAQMMARPAFDQNPIQYQGLGWLIGDLGDLVWIHTGGASGTMSLIFRGTTGDLAVAASFNSSPADEAVQAEAFADLFYVLLEAAAGVGEWPQHDLWSRYDPPRRPVLADAGIANAASQLGGAISPGETVAIYGDRVAPSSGAVRVLFDGEPARLVSVTPARVDAIVPASVARRSAARVWVEFGGARSNELVVPVANCAPGLFTASGNGRGPVLALDGASLNSEQNPAAGGSVVTLAMTGAAWHPRRPAMEVTIGGASAAVLRTWSALGRNYAAVCVPSGSSAGEVAIEVKVGDVVGRAGTTMFLK